MVFEGVIKAKVMVAGELTTKVGKVLPGEILKCESITTFPTAWIQLPPIFFTGMADFQKKISELNTKYQYAEYEVRAEAYPHN